MSSSFNGIDGPMVSLNDLKSRKESPDNPSFHHSLSCFPLLSSSPTSFSFPILSFCDLLFILVHLIGGHLGRVDMVHMSCIAIFLFAIAFFCYSHIPHHLHPFFVCVLETPLCQCHPCSDLAPPNPALITT